MSEIEKIAKIHAEKFIDERLCGHYLTVMKNFILRKDKLLIFVFKQHQLEAFAKAILLMNDESREKDEKIANGNENYKRTV
jgi:hypothetical protein